MPTLDTNCLVRWLIRDDPDKTAIIDALVASRQRLRVPNVAIIETVFVLQSFYQLSRDDVAEAINLLIGQATLDIDRELWSQVIAQYQAHPHLSCIDIYLSFDATRQSAGPLMTFDKKLISQLGAAWPQ